MLRFTGKSHLIRAIRRRVCARPGMPDSCLITTPTGVAAGIIGAGAITLASIVPSSTGKGKAATAAGEKARNAAPATTRALERIVQAIPPHVGLVIFDEGSMIASSTFQLASGKFVEALRNQLEGARDDSLPFAGMPVVLLVGTCDALFAVAC